MIPAKFRGALEKSNQENSLNGAEHPNYMSGVVKLFQMVQWSTTQI